MIRLHAVLCFCLLAIWPTTTTAAPQTEVPLSDLFERFGILVWKFETPPDLQEGEFISSYWMVQGTFTRTEPALEIRNVPAGTEVEIWIRVSVGEFQIPKDGLEYVLHYLGADGKPKQVRSHLQAPPGFPDVYGFTPSGAEISISEGHLLYLSRPDAEGLSILNLEYRNQD